MTKKNILMHISAFAVLAVPAVIFAHGAVEDGHVEGVAVEAVAVTGTGGSSALLQAFDPAWWGLLVGSGLLTAALSFGVLKFLHVPPIKRPDGTSGVPVTNEKK